MSIGHCIYHLYHPQNFPSRITEKILPCQKLARWLVTITNNYKLFIDRTAHILRCPEIDEIITINQTMRHRYWYPDNSTLSPGILSLCEIASFIVKSVDFLLIIIHRHSTCCVMKRIVNGNHNCISWAKSSFTCYSWIVPVILSIEIWERERERRERERERERERVVIWEILKGVVQRIRIPELKLLLQSVLGNGTMKSNIINDKIHNDFKINFITQNRIFRRVHLSTFNSLVSW